MAEKDLARRRRQLEAGVVELRVRIRRYTLDPRLRDLPKDAELPRQAD